MKDDTPNGIFEMLSRLNELDFCGFFKQDNRLGQVVIQLKKSTKVQLV